MKGCLERSKEWAKTGLAGFGLIAAIFLLALLVDRITLLKQLDTYFKEHPRPWTSLTLGAAVVGLALLLFVWASWGILAGRPMSEDEARDFMRTSVGQPKITRAFSGKAKGFTTPEGEVSFRQIKEAFRTGAWLRDPMMRVFCLGTIGTLLLVFGGFGYFVVTGPPTVKLLLAGTLLYAFGRTAWGFWKA